MKITPSFNKLCFFSTYCNSFALSLIGLLFLQMPIFAQHSVYRVPIMPEPPVLDGTIHESEWANAVRIDGFTSASSLTKKYLERRRASAFIGATSDHIYLAIRTQLPEEGELIAEKNLEELGPNSLSARMMYNDLVEVWIDPDIGQQRGKRYQMAANTNGKVFFNAIGYGGESDNLEWKSDWQSASKLVNGNWEFEVAIPIKSIAPGRKASDGAWGINICRDWQEPWIFSSINSSGEYAPSDSFSFVTDEAPSISIEQAGNQFAGVVDNTLRIKNVTNKPLQIKAGLVLESETMPEVAVDKVLQLAPGESKDVSVKIKDSVTLEFKQKASVKSLDGKTIFLDRQIAWKTDKSDWKWTTKPPAPPAPLDFDYSYYPTKNLLRLRVDLGNMPSSANVDKVTATIRGKDGKIVKSEPLDFQKNGKKETLVKLPDLDGTYEIALMAEGKNVPNTEVIKSFERKKFPWEGNKMGRSTKVYPPFTPIELTGNTLQTVLRKHELSPIGLWDQVTTTNPETKITKQLLAAPMHFETVVDGKHQEIEPDKLKVVEQQGDEVKTEALLRAGALSGKVLSTWDYDGTMRVDLTLNPSMGKEIEELTLVIPLREEEVSHFHAMGDTLRAYPRTGRLPTGNGAVWTAKEVLTQETRKNFCTYIFLGSPSRGLCWFAENDYGWSWDSQTPNVEVVRENHQVQLRVHLINIPLVINEPRTITFGVLAAPVKPRLAGDWRYKWRREKYTLLGGSINWFGMGSGGGFYPPGKDTWFWEMLKKGNTEKVSKETIEATVKRGEPYWENYGHEYVENWGKHVRVNMTSRFNQRMVFYYNRSSHQFADEFQTFKDEWSLTDFRAVGQGNSIEEIKIVPSDSYIDMAMYWYAKAFKIAGNQGVYWDNWYFKASFNTFMTSAYQKADATIVPSVGLWGLRNLSKRTFVMMNELGLTPIVMSHMTGTNILPILAFDTVQYDWEWKQDASWGDVQDRFARDYILMVSTGELAGTWPVLLGDATNNEWLKRTYAAVSIVHELDNRFETVKPGTYAAIDAILAEQDVDAYRYWDERPQPVKTNSAELPAIAYVVKGKKAIVAVTSYTEKDADVTVEIDPTMMGFLKGYRIVDTETGEQFDVKNNSIRFPLEKHNMRILEILPL